MILSKQPQLARNRNMSGKHGNSDKLAGLHYSKSKRLAVSRPLLSFNFIYTAITQREWKRCTCLGIALSPNKFRFLLNVRRRKSQSDISTHTCWVRFTQQHLCLSPTGKKDRAVKEEYSVAKVTQSMWEEEGINKSQKKKKKRAEVQWFNKAISWQCLLREFSLSF